MAERAARRRPTRFDRADILSRISLADVLTREVGPPKTRAGAEPWWPSVDPALPGTGKTPPTHIAGTDSQGVEHFKDFASGRSGTAVDVLVLRRGIGVGEALRLLAEQAGLVAGGPPIPPAPARPAFPIAARPASRPPSSTFAEWIEACAEQLWSPRHRLAGEARAWLAGRGYGEAILKAARVGFDVGGRWDTVWPKERRAEHGIPSIAGVTFPMFGADGKLAYAQTRNLRWHLGSPWPKYVNPSGVVANPAVAYWRDPGPRAGAPVFIVEGPTDALAIRQVGYDVAALLGSGQAAAPATTERLLQTFGMDRAYLILTDADEAGRLAAERLIDDLAGRQAAAVVARPQRGVDVADWASLVGADLRPQLADLVSTAYVGATTEVRRLLSSVSVRDGRTSPMVLPPTGPRQKRASESRCHTPGVP